MKYKQNIMSNYNYKLSEKVGVGNYEGASEINIAAYNHMSNNIREYEMHGHNNRK